MNRKFLLPLILLLVLACRLPYEVGRSLSPNVRTAAAQTSQTPVAVSAGHTATPSRGAPGQNPGSPSPAATRSTAFPGQGKITPSIPGTAGPANPGLTPLLPTTSGIPSNPYPGAGPAFTLTPSAGIPGQPTRTANLSVTPTGAGQNQQQGPTEAANLTPTQIPSPTIYLTPTPTITPSPTVTRTPLPPPAWSRAPLQSTDPGKVKLASGKVQLVEFFAYWSGPSQALAPIIQGVQAEYSDQVNFVYLDIDNPAVDSFKSDLGFQREPQFFLLDPQGRVLKQWVGYVSVSDLRAAIDAAINS